MEYKRPRIRMAEKHPSNEEEQEKPTPLGRLFDALTSWFFVTCVIAVAPALAIWPAAHADELDHVVSNQLDVDLRVDFITAIAISAVVVFGFYALAHALTRRHTGLAGFPETCRQLNRYTHIIIVLPVLVHLLNPGIESSNRLFTLALIAICTGFVAVFVYRLQETPPPKPRHNRVTAVHWGLVVGAFVFYGGFMSYLAVLDHRNIGTHTYDLGIYTNLFHRTANGDFLGCSYCKLEKHVSSHFDPIIWVFSWIYRLKPDAETLLIIQANWLGTIVFPLFLIAKRRFDDPRMAVGLCWLATLYPPLHGANMFDFHSLTMVVPTVVWLIYFVDSGSKFWLWVGLGLMLITREDMPLLACFVGAYAILKRRHLVGFAMVAISLSYLAVVKLMIMPDPGLLMDSKETTSFAHFFKDMIPHSEEGLKGYAITLLTSPTFALDVLFREGRVFFGLVLFMPLLFMPLLAARKRFMMLYGLAFLGLASRKYVYDLHFQYSSVLFPILLAATPDGVVQFAKSRIHDAFSLDRRRIVPTVMLTMGFAMALTTVKYGAMVPNRHFRAGWNSPKRTLDEERYEDLQKLLEQIPDEAAVCASSSLGPHVSARVEAYKWPSCKESEYALLTSRSFKKKKSRRRLDRLIRKDRLVELDTQGDLILYEYYPPSSKGRPDDADALEAEANRRPSLDADAEDEDEGEDDDDPTAADRDDARRPVGATLRPTSKPQPRPSRDEDGDGDEDEDEDGSRGEE